MEPDLEQVYYPHALRILEASPQGQSDILVLHEDHTAARRDLRIYVRDMYYPSEMKAVNGSTNPLTDPIGFLCNRPIFAKLHKIIMTKLLKPGVGVISCALSTISLDSKEPSYGFRCLTRYIDTLCIENGVPIIPIAFVNSGGERYDTKEAHIINRGRKSLIIQVRHKDEVFKVGDYQSIQNEQQKHAVVDGKVPNIRPMVEGAFGNVEGVEGLAFVKLQGCGICISMIQWEELPGF